MSYKSDNLSALSYANGGREEWRHIRGLDVSSNGQVAKSGRVLRGDILNTGYRRIRMGASGKSGTEMVHRLVCEAFYGAPPSAKHQALHRDDVKANNNASNLYWGLPSDNCSDRYWNGKSRALLDSRAVQLIRFEYHKAKTGRTRVPKGTLVRLSRIFRVSTDIIRNAVRAYVLEKDGQGAAGGVVTTSPLVPIKR